MNKAPRFSCLLMAFIFPTFAIKADKELSIRYPSTLSVWVESKNNPNDAKLFKSSLVHKLRKDESSEQYSKPGLEVVEGYEDGDYLLSLKVETSEKGGTDSENKAIIHMIVNASLWFRINGEARVLSRDFICNGSEFNKATQQCVDLISDELKSAQVKKGKRAGKLGWDKNRQ